MGITIDGLKGVADFLRKADKIPEYQQILDAMATIGELRLKLADYQDKVRFLEAEIEAIRADQGSAEGIRRVGDFMVLNNEFYCVGCWKLRKRLGPLVNFRLESGRLRSRCCLCEQEFPATMGI